MKVCNAILYYNWRNNKFIICQNVWLYKNKLNNVKCPICKCNF